jgi:hypothetical protein
MERQRNHAKPDPNEVLARSEGNAQIKIQENVRKCVLFATESK